MIIRILTTAVDPEDIERGKELLKDRVQPAFDGFPGCHGLEVYIGVEEHSGDLIDIAAVSKWDSLDAVQKATTSPEYEDALADLRRLYAETPIVHHYRALD